MLSLTGLSPFMGDNDAETFANITRADYDLEDEAFDAISNDAKDFISSLLVKRKEYAFDKYTSYSLYTIQLAFSIGVKYQLRVRGKINSSIFICFYTLLN